MTRSLIVKIHVYLAAFLAPILFMVAISGGLYLVGIKGGVDSTPVEIPAGMGLDPKSTSLDADMRSLLDDLNIDHNFEYVKVSGNTLFTRPTSRVHYQFNTGSGAMTASRNEPSIQKRLIELHKGHGPLWFKDFQKFLAAGLLFILLSGLWLGLISPGLRNVTLVTSGAGLVIFVLLGFVI